MKIMQVEVNWAMRSILINWLVEVQEYFHLCPEVLFLAVNYIDRFLSCKCICNDRLQLVGIVALSIAAKFESTWNPSMTRFVNMCDNAYTTKDISKAEVYMLQKLNHDLGWPGPLNFLRRINDGIDDYNPEARMLAKYLLEVTIMDERFVAERPSVVAAAAYCLAIYMLKMGDWVRCSVLSKLNSLTRDLVTRTCTYFQIRLLAALPSY
jgi:hypothetical protein